jgi:phosphoglycerate dehydrogenase-like enzyme
VNKENIYNLLSGFYNPKYVKERINLLIEINKYYDINTWNSCIDRCEFRDKFNIFYSSNRFEIYKIIRTADAYFTFGLNPVYDLSNLMLIYFAASEDYETANPNLKVFSSKGISKQAIAEYCLCMSYNLMMGINRIIRNDMNHIWMQPEFANFRDKSLQGKVIGVVGLGNNGISICNLFRKIGCRVIGTDLEKSKAQFVDEYFNEIDDLLPESDILILSVSAGRNSPELLGLSRLQKMKKEAFLINISRGSVLNETDLRYALKKGILSGAALDVFRNEPLSPHSKLWKCRNLIITPHIAGNINMFKEEIISDFIVKIKDNFGV